MVKDLVVIGSGGLNIVRLIEDINSVKKTYNFIGFLESDETKIGKEVLGYPIIGNDDLLLDKLSHCCVVNNVMHTTRTHEKVTNKLINDYHISEFVNLIHPDVDMRGVTLGCGNILYRDNKIDPYVNIGDFNLLYGATIGHETRIGNFNLLATCFIGSRAVIGSFNLIGNSATISNSIKLGDDNEIGVGSVVMKHYKNGNHLLGNPAIDLGEFIRKYLRK